MASCNDLTHSATCSSDVLTINVENENTILQQDWYLQVPTGTKILNEAGEPIFTFTKDQDGVDKSKIRVPKKE